MADLLVVMVNAVGKRLFEEELAAAVVYHAGLVVTQMDLTSFEIRSN